MKDMVQYTACWSCHTSGVFVIIADGLGLWIVVNRVMINYL